jgi:urease accessory protein
MTLWQLLQLSDQLFPTGAFAYSHGLEAYVEQGLVQDRATCQQLFDTLCWHTLGPCDLVFCVHAFRRAATQNLKALIRLDRRLHAFKLTKELRLESQHTGQAFLRASLALHPPLVAEQFLQAIQHGTTPGHHAITFGLLTQSLGIPETSALQSYLYTVVAAWVAAALRLVPLGQSEGQRVLHGLMPTLRDILQRFRHLSPDEAWSCTPGLDIRSMQHERQYSRLFRS